MKKISIIAISVFAICAITIIIVLQNTSQSISTEKELIEKSVSISFPSDATLVHSKGFKQNWFGEGVQFYVYSIDDAKWNSFVSENSFHNWDELPLGETYKDALNMAYTWLDSNEQPMLSQALNSTDGYLIVRNLDNISIRSNEIHMPLQNTVVCIVSSTHKQVYFCEIDL